MELDSLKDIWKELDEADLQPGRKEVPISSMLQNRSKSTIAMLKRNLNRELIVVLALYTASIAYIVMFLDLYNELAVLLALVGCAFLLYYYHKNKLLKQMECVDREVRSNLKQQLVTLEKYVRFYFIAGAVITPLAYFAAGIIILFNSQDGVPSLSNIGVEAQTSVSQMPITSTISNHRFFIVFLSLGVVVSVGSYFLNKWFVNKMYGQHVARLKELLYQMEEEA